VNPDRRGHVIGAAIIAALLVLGAGFGIGYAAAPSGDHHVVIRPGRGFLPGRMDLYPNGRFPERAPRSFPNQSGPSPSSTPSTSPSSSPTPSGSTSPSK
jgi:hypothetical protein